MCEVIARHRWCVSVYANGSQLQMSETSIHPQRARAPLILPVEQHCNEAVCTAVERDCSSVQAELGIELVTLVC